MMERMRAIPRTHLRSLAGLALVLGTLPVYAGGAAHNDLKKFAGVYKGETRAADESREQSREGAYAIKHHTIVVSLGTDGTATVTQSPDAVSESTSFAHWARAGNEIRLTFDPQAGKPASAPMVFNLRHNELVPVAWDHAAWKKQPPPTLHRETQD